ncbi:hypothetical protein HD806DRAFT_512996 [Xylariaceae sp. AK1471]|nr:hypothetical protein HD806DRAFT_512996 [Xylariaceae sp. AK1471]
MFRESWAEKSGNSGLHLEYYIIVFGLKHYCLDPSDKVRGLLGLANNMDRRDIERAGYSSDESPSVIYRKIAAYIATHRYHNSELVFLCLGREPRRGKNFQERMPPLPTWVPDLSIPPWESFPTLTRNAWESDDNFCASKSKSGSSTSYSREFENDGGISVWPSGLVLTVRGIVVDTVKDVGDVYDLDIDSIDFSSGTSRLTLSQKTHHKAILDQAIDLTRRASMRNEGRYPRQWTEPTHRCEIFSPCVDYYHAASQTLTCGRDPSKNGKPYQNPLDGGLFKYPCRSFRPQNTEFETEVLHEHVLFEGSLDRHFRRLRRSFMVSETGYLGIVPLETRARDRICVLYGCSVPVILRRDDDRPFFFFVGECYVHGIMYGEALDDVVAGNLLEREFDLV